MAKNPFSDPNFGASASTNTSEASNPFADPEFGKPPKPRTLATVANDTVIEVANAAAGGVASIGNFIKPGNAASGWIDKNIIKAGEDAQSDVVKASKQKFRQEVDSADGIAGELGAVGRYVAQNPLLSAAQAAGSFAGPGLAVKGVTGVKALEKFGPKAVEYAGRAAGALTGAAMSGGDAAGTAYELASKAGATEDQAVSAGRKASVIPAIIGGLSGVVGAEGLLAGGKGFAGGTISKALKTGAVEASGEAVEEGVTQYEGQRAAMPYDKSIDPTKGVAAAAGMGAALGGITGAGASLLSGGQNQPADTGQAEREPTTSPGAAGPAQPGPTSPAAPVAPDWATSPGAAAPNPYGGIDFTREVDTSGLSLADPADTIASRLKPSEVMGLNPSAGALSREVAAFVDAQPFTEVTPIETRTGIGAQRRLGEQPIIDVDAREVIDPQQTIAARLAGPSQAAPLQQAIAQLPYNPATQGDSLADQAPQAIQAATQRTQAGAAQAEPTLTDGYGQAWDSLDAESRASVARSAGARGVMARNVASKGWGDLSPNLRSSISTAIESARSVGAPAIQLGNQPQGASNVGNAIAPQAGSVPAAAGSPNALSQGERRAGLSGNGDGVGRVGDGAGQRIAGAGFGEAGTAPVAGRSGVAPALTQGVAPILQNRNRSNPSSIAQMQGIAADPDYGRLGFSRDFANGAPVVAGGTVPADQVGRSDVAVASDGRRIPVQYAVVEASDVLASNQVDGTPNADYGNQSVTRIRAIAGNGRIAGLQRAYGMGTSDGYAGELLSDVLHGVNPDVIRSMRQPVLVRVMPADQVTQDIGDVSNTTGNLSLSPVEQANNDAQRVSLDALQFSEDGAITSDTVRQFVRAMPQAEQGELIDTNGQPTKQAVDRINAAVFARAYGNDQLIRLFAQAQDPEARNVLSALAQVAPKMARLEGAGSLDIRDVVTQAAEIAVNARREGRPLANAASQIDMTADPMVGEVLKLFARNARTVRPVVDALGAAADFAYTEANKPAEDMFGAVPKATRSDVLGSLSPQNEQASQANLEQPARGKPVQVDAVKPGADAGAATDAAATQAGRPAEADREALTLEAQTEEDLRAKAEREDAATSQAAAEKAAEQERLRREAEARDNKARADATVDDFQLGQTADQQMSGMDDMFGGARDAAPAAEPDAVAQPSAQDATPAPATKSAKPAATIEDFGERLEGARKFLPPSLQEDIGDDQIASLPLSKVWPSDAHESIEDASGAALTFAARQEIPAKPRVAYKVRGWVEKVKTFRRIVRDFDGASIELMEKLAQKRGYDSLAPFFAKVKLLTQLPRDTWGRIEKVGEYPDARRGKTAEELRASGLESRPFDKDKLWLGGSLYRIDTGEPLTMDQQQDEAWVANPFSSVTIDGKTHSFDVGRIGPDEVQKVRELLGSDAPKKGGLTASDFEVRGSAKSGYRINRKGDSEYRALKTFTGEGAAKKALAWRDENVAELEAAWEAVKARDNVSKADVRRDENRERLGENRRDGKDVTPEMFEKALGFRGVQFGNWVAQGKGAKDRQGLLNEAYDAMLDLADVLGIPPRAVSLNGSLGLSLGARGAGKASAHFEPSNLVINLTKTRGAGTLAHEWFHALDNYFSRLRGGEVAFTGDQAEYRRSNYITYKPEAAWVKTMGARFTLPLTSSQLRAKLQQLGGAQYDPSKTIEQNAKDAGWQRDPKHKEGVRPEVERAFVDLVQALNESPMAKRASAMDKAGSDGYWGRIIERGARSFENYVINKLAQRGWSNDFLANVRDWKEWEQVGKNSDRYPYLRPDEEAPIVAAFDALFDVVETRETEGGNVAMFSRTGASLTEGDALPNMEYARIRKALPEIDNYAYDFETRQFVSATQGNARVQVPGDLIASLVDQARKAGLSAGRSTIQRAILTGTLKRGEALLSSVREIGRATAPDNLKGTLYQRGQGAITARDSDAQLTAAQQITDAIAARWQNAPADIIVARNMQDASIPEAVRKHDAELKSQGATGEPRGFIYKGKVYLLSDQLKTTSDVIEVLLHESLGHYGLRGVFGDSLKPILQQVGNMRRADVVAKAREYGLFDAEKVGENASDRDVWVSMTDKQRLDAAEEVLAEMAQTRPDLGFVQRAISAIRNWLRANVLGFQNLRMKNADIVQAYILPARGWVERGGASSSVNRQVANEPGARYSAREQDLLFSGDEAPTSGRPGYETDLFGDPLPISAGRLAPARSAQSGVRGDTQPATGLSDTAAPEGSYRVRTIIGQEVSRKLGADTILTPEQAAQATAYLYRSAVERFDAIVTDKNGKPLAVVGSFKGALTQTSVYPGTVIAEAVRVPGAARIWFSHNHPSGKSALSDADKMLNNTLSSVFDGTSIEPMGTLAVTGKSFEHVSPDGFLTYGATPAPSASINVPVIERELDPGNKDADIILDSPAKAREHGSALYRDAGEPGLMILDAQHRVAAWVPVRGAMKGKLMGTGGLDAVYRAVSESNAGSVIIIHGGELDAGRGDGNVWSIAQNLGAALRGTDVRVLDIIDVNKPRSAAETGADLVARSVFSRTQDQTQTEAFKRWFGDSKVVDDKGQPLVVYHGTAADFDAFDKKKSGAVWSSDKEGFFFSSESATASEYADFASSQTVGAANVMPVYVSLKNPLTLEKFAEITNGIRLRPRHGGGADALTRFFDDERDLLVRYAKQEKNDGILLEKDGKMLVVAFRPDQIKSAIGNNGNFDPADPRINFSRTSTATGAQSAWDAPTPTGFDDVIYKLQDKNIDAKRVIEAITKSVGKVADAVNVYLQEELFHGRAASRVAEFGARELKPMLNQMKLAGLTMDEVGEFLHARHAKEANAVIAQRNPGDPGMQDGGSGMTNADADAYFAKLPASQRSKLEAIAKRVDAMIAGTRKLYVQYGLEDQAVVDGWTGMFKNYIPLMRENKDGGMGIGQGFSVKGKEVKGRTGSKRKVVDILANIAAQREKVIVRGEKNRVAQALVGLAWANPNKAFWEVRSQAPTERVYDDKLKKVVDRPDPMFKSRDNVLSAKVKDSKGNVTEQFVVFNEDNPRAVRLASAMKNLDAGNLEGLLGVSAKITRYFSAINTQYNPVFGVVNLVRDVQGAMVNLAATPLAGEQAKIAKDAISALSGIYGDIRKTRKGGQATSPWAKLWEQMQEDGGTTGYRELFKTSADREASLKAIINPDAWMDSKWGKVFTADGKLKVPMSVAKEKAGDLFNWLSDYNEAMENGVRLAAYKAALDKGMSRQQAASLSKNLTVNFNRKGQVGMQAGAVYAFFNAAMQGTTRIGQTLFDMEGGDIKTIRLSSVGKKVVYGGVLLGVMQALALSAAGFDDEDPPEFLRERSLIIPTGGKTYISIPMPLGLHVIPGLGRHATEFALSGFSKPAERAVSVVGMFADAFNPIGNAGLSMQTVAPTALDPFVALSENRDWTGKPIARTSMNKAEPGHNQWKDTATGFSKTIAEAINWLSGGNEYVAGAFSPTPDQIDYLIAQVGGGVAREVSKVMQTGSSITSGEELPTYKMPLLGRFVGSANGQASQGSAFYANLNKLNALETEIKGLRKDGKYEEAAALVRERPESSLIAFANKAERDVQKLRRDKRELIANDADRDAVRAKEDQITSVMTRLNELTKKRTESVQ